jgi:hypothetical protein
LLKPTSIVSRLHQVVAACPSKVSPLQITLQPKQLKVALRVLNTGASGMSSLVTFHPLFLAIVLNHAFTPFHMEFFFSQAVVTLSASVCIHCMPSHLHPLL